MCVRVCVQGVIWSVCVCVCVCMFLSVCSSVGVYVCVCVYGCVCVCLSMLSPSWIWKECSPDTPLSSVTHTSKSVTSSPEYNPTSHHIPISSPTDYAIHVTFYSDFIPIPWWLIFSCLPLSAYFNHTLCWLSRTVEDVSNCRRSHLLSCAHVTK